MFPLSVSIDLDSQQCDVHLWRIWYQICALFRKITTQKELHA